MKFVKKSNVIISTHDTHIVVDVSTNKLPNKYLLICKQDWERIKSIGGRVFASKGSTTTYASVVVDGKLKRVHRLIFPASKVVDHINHNGLDNRRSNLRPCTQSENLMNRRVGKRNKTGIVGVSFDRSRKKYIVSIRKGADTYNLGRFETIDEAASARKSAEIRLFGEYNEENR